MDVVPDDLGLPDYWEAAGRRHHDRSGPEGPQAARAKDGLDHDRLIHLGNAATIGLDGLEAIH